MHNSCAKRIYQACLGSSAGKKIAVQVIGIGMAICAQAQMTTPGSFDVSPMGAATYTIPLRIPSGIAGTQPALAFAYNSQGSYGLMGTGWSVSGLSVISRCPQTLAQDGVRGGIKYDTNDRYCLDGQRLISVLGGVDGANGTQYRTELQNFSKITSYSKAGTTAGPGSFIVKTKNGLTMEYGETMDSRIEAQGKAVVVTWALNKVIDAAGNYFIVSYVEDNANGQFYPQRIEYTGNSSASSAILPGNAIVFEYEDRPDVRPMYHMGSLMRNNVRLKKVVGYVNAGSVPAKTIEYILDYSQAGGNLISKLISVKECNSVGLCFPPVRFMVADETASREYNYPEDPRWGNINFTWLGDFNGDGNAEIASAIGEVIYIKRPGDTQSWSAPGVWGTAEYTWPGDFNGDGRTDIASAAAGNVHMKLSRENNVSGPGYGIFESAIWSVPNQWGATGYTWVADFNGDGKSDIASASGGNVYVRISTGEGFTAQTWVVSNQWGAPEHTWVGDFDGDGKSDIATAIGGTVYVNISTGTGFEGHAWSVTNFWTGRDYTWAADFNGDGKTDLASASGGNIYVRLSTGAAFQESIWSVPNVWGAAGYTWVGDFNGDGMADIASAVGANIYIRYSTGQGFSQEIWASSGNWGVPGYNWLGSFDGTGKTDFLSVRNGVMYYKKSMGSTEPSVSGVDQGLGNSVSWTLNALSNMYLWRTRSCSPGRECSHDMIPPTYTTEVDSDGDVLTSISPLKVVTWVDFKGGGQSRILSYTYDSARASKNGRGLMGFNWIQSSDRASGISERNYYRSDWPYAGMISRSSRGTSSYTYEDLSVTTNTFGCYDPAIGPTEPCTVAPGKRYFVYPVESQTRSWDLDGIALPGSRTRNQNWDGYGNVGSVTTLVLNPDGSPSEHSQVTTSTYNNDTARWHFGRLLKRTVVSTGPTVPTPVTPLPDGTWSRVAGEGGSFNISGTRIVRFGADTRWVQRSMTGSGQWCTVGFFGSDPAPGMTNSCEVFTPGAVPPAPEPPAPEETWTRVAGEGGTFNISGTRTVRFGADTRWVQRSMTGSGQWCTAAFFGGDPAPGVTNSCEVLTPAP